MVTKKLFQLEHSCRPGLPDRRSISLRCAAILIISCCLSHRPDAFFNLSDVQPLSHDLGSKLFLHRPIGTREQGAGMAGGQLTRSDHALHGAWELKEPKGICNSRAALAHPLGHLFLGQLELIDQLLEGRSLLERIEIFTMKIFDQGLLE